MIKAKCYNPECGYILPYVIRNPNNIPKVCPICGYDKSEEDRKRRIAQDEFNRKKDEGFSFKELYKWIVQD